MRKSPDYIEAKKRYWQGETIAQIARDMGVSYGTLYSRKSREEWDEVPITKRFKLTAEQEYLKLLDKDNPTDRELKRIDVLGREVERCARLEKHAKTKKDSDLNPNIKKRNEGKKAKKNNISDEDAVRLIDDFHDCLFDYQKLWHDNSHRRIRNILKSRQTGATWYFAREGFIRALEKGESVIFLSASKAQAMIFRKYIVAWVKAVTGVELVGEKIVLPNGAELAFLGTNAKTAQGYSGHIYMDEYFWIGGFNEFKRVASAMASHKQWTLTYFSTPSTLAHQAYPHWTGENVNRGRAKKDRIEIDVSHQALKKGRLCEDGQWKHILTIEDAEQGGCDLFDIEQLKLENSPDEFQNLYLCQFVDDAQSVFKFDKLQKCGVDTLEKWDDFDPDKRRPFGNNPVWLGYDPSRSRDDASAAILAPPAVPGGKFRVLETFSYNGLDFDTQARKIRDMCGRYAVEKMTIDASGMGQGVYELVKQFFPGATRLNYSVEVKKELVLKALQKVNRANIEWDAGKTEIPSAFMTIHKTTTSGGAVTYKATRSESTGHADVAWSIMHALMDAPMMSIDNDQPAQSKGFIETYG